MKLVIQTQYCENYGDAQKPYWKFKGGSTYIVANLSDKQAQRIKRDGIPTLKSLIEYKNDFSEEYVTEYRVVADEAVVCEEWETPRMLSYENGQWVCREDQPNDGSFREPIARKCTKYTMVKGGDRADFECMYLVDGGRLVSSKDIAAYFESYKKA